MNAVARKDSKGAKEAKLISRSGNGDAANAAPLRALREMPYRTQTRLSDSEAKLVSRSGHGDAADTAPLRALREMPYRTQRQLSDREANRISRSGHGDDCERRSFASTARNALSHAKTAKRQRSEA